MTTNQTILVVDDEETIREVVRRYSLQEKDFDSTRPGTRFLPGNAFLSQKHYLNIYISQTLILVIVHK